jgi:hypothetical protein
MSFWHLPAGFGGNARAVRVARHPFTITAPVEQVPDGLLDPLQPLLPELWHDYWTGDAPPQAGELHTGSVASATFVAREGAALVVRVQCEGEAHADYLVDLDALAEQIVTAHLVRTGHGTLQRARLKAGEARRYAARLAAQAAGGDDQPQSNA